MKLLYKLFKLIFTRKIKFNNPERSDLLLFDDSGKDIFDNILYTKNYSILRVRYDRIKVIYITLDILILMIKNLHPNLFTCYLISLIKIIKPKIIITAIDNSFKFSEIAKVLHKKIVFIAVQNASRHDFDRNKRLFEIGSLKQDDNKRFFLPNYYCFGDLEEEDCKKYNIKVFKFYKIGSLRLTQYLKYLKENKLKTNSYKYQVSLISEPSAGTDKLWKQVGVEKGCAKIAKFTIKLCVRNNLSFTFIKKRQYENLSILEMKWYREFLDENEFNFLIKNSTPVSKTSFSSYKAIHQSEISIGIHSTLLREKLALKGKILACNFTPLQHYDFPIKGFCFLKDPSFEEFERRALKILKIDEKEYSTQINNAQLVRIEEDNTQYEILNKNIRKVLDQ